MSLPLYYIDLSDYNLWIAALYIVCTPLFWNVIVRLECRGHYLTRLFGTPKRAAVVFAVVIVTLGLCRDMQYGHVVKHQPHWYLLQENSVLWSGYAIMLIGTFLIFSSFKTLGFYATFFGYEFGISVQQADSFPFNLMDHPMYIGSTLNFLGLALVFASQSGLLLTFVVAITYTVVGFVESSFRTELHKQRTEIEKKVT